MRSVAITIEDRPYYDNPSDCPLIFVHAFKESNRHYISRVREKDCFHATPNIRCYKTPDNMTIVVSEQSELFNVYTFMLNIVVNNFNSDTKSPLSKADFRLRMVSTMIMRELGTKELIQAVFPPARPIGTSVI